MKIDDLFKIVLIPDLDRLDDYEVGEDDEE